jgi:hypothetical protein
MRDLWTTGAEQESGRRVENQFRNHKGFFVGGLSVLRAPDRIAARKYELKDGAARCVCARRESPPVLFDDRTQIDKPMPKRCAFVVQNGSKTRLTSTAGSPGPETCTVIDTPFDESGAVLISHSRGPVLVVLIASTALRIKLSIACCNCTRSPRTSGIPSWRTA